MKRSSNEEGTILDSSPSKQTRTGEKNDNTSRARIVVVGAGAWSQGWHLPHLQSNPEAEIAAIVDPCIGPRATYTPGGCKPLEELGTRYDTPIFKDFDEFIRSDKSAGVQGVIVCTPHNSHYDICMKAMQAGLHILVEKPMTADVGQARALVKESASYERTFMVNNSANFRAHALKAQELLKLGRIGDVEHVSCYMMRERALFESSDPANANWVKPSGGMLGNGMAWGQLSHTLAWVYMVTGLSPANVFCYMNYSRNSGADLYSSTSIKCTNGATISMQGVASLPGSTKDLNFGKSRGKLIENKIFGTEGCLFYSGDDANPESGELQLSRHDGDNETMPGFYFENTKIEGIGPESLQAFIGGCFGKTVVNAADAEMGLKVVQTIDAMYRSAKSGCAEALS